MKDQERLEEIRSQQKEARNNAGKNLTIEVEEEESDANVVVKNYLRALKYTIAKGEVE